MKKMSILGVGPKLALLTLLYAIPVFIINNLNSSIFRIALVSPHVLTIIGAALLIVGIPFLIISVITIEKVYKQDVLYTKGIYSLCRHPLYSSWIVFIIPGIGLFKESWLIMSVPVVMYFLLRMIIKKEETYLLDKFGTEYLNYKNKVNFLFPMFWRYSKK